MQFYHCNNRQFFSEEKSKCIFKCLYFNRLLSDIDRNGYQCTGKPEPLSGNFAGYWSVRIDDKNRIVFRIDGNNIEIMQCGTHDKDK